MSASFDAAAQGSPDWQGGILTENFNLLTAYGNTHLYFAVPRGARLARKADGSPQFFLEFVSDRNDSKAEDSLYAVLDLGLERNGDIAGAYNLIPTGAALMPATFTTGTYCHLECGDSHETAPFAWENAQRATVHSRISPNSGQLVYAALATGTITVAKAAVECGMAAFLPRIESTVTFNAANLLASLATLNPGGSSVAFRRMVTFFDNLPGGLLRFEGNDKGATGRSVGLALAGRVRHHFGQPAPCPRISDGPHVVLRLPPDGAPAVNGWDLRTPMLTEVPVFLDFDPFTPIVSIGGRERVTAFTRVPMLPDDLKTERVTVASGLPPNIRNCEAIELTLRVDKGYSRSGMTAVEPVRLHPDGARSATVELKFAKIGQKPYSARIRGVWQDTVRELPWFDCSGDYLYVGAERLPGTSVTVQATAELLGQASVSIAITGGSGQASLTATLTTDEPAASFLLPVQDSSARITISARDQAKSDKALMLDLPCRSVTLDLATFREYGPQTTNVTVQFKEAAQAVQFEFLPECGEAEPIVLGFSPSRASGQFSYFSTGIFRSRYRFRQSSPPGDRETQWSDYRVPGEDLIIDMRQEGAGPRTASADARRNESA
jgi:hypothetical protein